METSKSDIVEKKESKEDNTNKLFKEYCKNNPDAPECKIYDV
jgi:hypothetical protein